MKKKRRTPEEHKAHYSKLCKECGDGCCRHIALEIDTPTTNAEFDHIRWFLFHKGIKVFIDHDGSWNLEVATDCRSLKKGRCLSYETRPSICRDYPGEEKCEFEDPGRLACRKVFTDVRQFERWLERRRARRGAVRPLNRRTD